ncbi:MAG TPA: 50S ribosomal protein L10 [Candidatus Binataceae bacterium]|nr:50S ribosomal protein L10 [Candidatus Binataceae bacterium]
MKRSDKGALVAALTQRMGEAKLALVSEYQGMTAAQSTEFRRRMRAARAEFKIAKNTLMRRAIGQGRFAGLERYLGGPVGVILSFGDPVAAAKAVSEFRDAGDKFKLRGGLLDGQVLSREEVLQLAAMPPREVVIAQLLGLIQAPASRLVRLLNEPGAGLARLMDALAKKAQAAEPPAQG